jgi:hypothetical protein
MAGGRGEDERIHDLRLLEIAEIRFPCEGRRVEVALLDARAGYPAHLPAMAACVRGVGSSPARC